MPSKAFKKKIFKRKIKKRENIMENQLGHNTPDLSSYSLHLATIKNKQINHTLKKKRKSTEQWNFCMFAAQLWTMVLNLYDCFHLPCIYACRTLLSVYLRDLVIHLTSFIHPQAKGDWRLFHQNCTAAWQANYYLKDDTYYLSRSSYNSLFRFRIFKITTFNNLCIILVQTLCSSVSEVSCKWRVCCIDVVLDEC